MDRNPSPKRSFDALDENENSPGQIACTQEYNENIDVVWDWNSPQTKKQPRKCQKRLLVHSPKLMIKRHPSGSSIQEFEKLKEELKSLREQLAVNENEESFQLSPIEEAEYKSFRNENPLNSLEHDLLEHEFDELDDDMDAQLFIFSQQLEEGMKSFENKHSPQKSPKLTFKKTSPKERVSASNVFDDLLTTVETNLDKTKGSETEFKSLKSEVHVSNHSNQICSRKVEFHRTHSFEMANVGISKTCPKRFTPEEVERKRLEALAKLEAKKKLGGTAGISQCSAEEIEQKRLQALAKIKAKSEQDSIEKKRQEALKRLQMHRRKNATNVKSSLADRLK